MTSQRVPRSEKTLFVRSAEVHCVRVPGPEKLIYDENGEVLLEQWAFMLFQLLYSVRCYDAFFICKADLLHTKKT